MKTAERNIQAVKKKKTFLFEDLQYISNRSDLSRYVA